VGRPSQTAGFMRRLSILVVDNDQRMLRAYGRALGGKHDVVIAADAQEAIELIESGTVADVVVAELALPGMDGAALHRWMKREHPRLARSMLFVTSSLTKSAKQGALEAEGRTVLPKPVVRERLLEAVREASRLR